MKLNLECGNLLRSGYLNINSYSPQLHENVTEDTPFAIGHYKRLEPVVQNEKFEEIIFNLPLNVLTPEELLSVVAYWKNFLTENGILKIFFIDIRRVAKATQAEDISIQESHDLIYGQNYIYKSIMESNIFKAMCKAVGLTIETISLKDFYASFELRNIKN